MSRVFSSKEMTTRQHARCDSILTDSDAILRKTCPYKLQYYVKSDVISSRGPELEDQVIQETAERQGRRNSV